MEKETEGRIEMKWTANRQNTEKEMEKEIGKELQKEMEK